MVVSELVDQVNNLFSEAKNAVFSEKVRDGFLSDNYILTNGNKRYFLKQYRYEHDYKIKEIHRVKFFLSSAGVPIILPIKNKFGESFFNYEDKLYALFPFVNGSVIANSVRSEKANISAGKMLAKIHLVGRKGFPDVGEQAKGWDRAKFTTEVGLIEKELNKIKNKNEFDELVTKSVGVKKRLVGRNKIEYADLSLESPQLIHGDYHERNIFFDENDQVKYVFDLEKTAISPRVLELVRSVMLMFFADGFEKDKFNDAHVYIEAYRDIFPVTKRELIKGFRAHFINSAHSLWVEKEHYLVGNTRVDSLLNSNLKILEYFEHNFDDFVENLA